MPEPFYLRPIHDVLLKGSERTPFGLFHLQIATADQLCRLASYKPTSITAIKARLKELTDQEYLQADAYPTKRGNGWYYYVLGPKGFRYMKQLGFDVNEAWRASKEIDKHGTFLDHTFELNDVIISAAMIHQADPRLSLHHFVHERVMKRTPFEFDWKVEGHTRHYRVIPDAFLDFRFSRPGQQLRLPVFLEHDRATEKEQAFKRRIRAYIGLLATETHKARLGDLTVTVAFSTFEGETRRDEMRQWTLKELKELKAAPKVFHSFAFAALPKPLYPRMAWLDPLWLGVYNAAEQPYGLLTM